MKKFLIFIALLFFVIVFFVGLTAIFDYVMYKLTGGNKQLQFAYVLFGTPITFFMYLGFKVMEPKNYDE